ncbi:hypothetical protein ACQKWADRAFT_207313 [Trichoderma austrokoningii]
MYKRKFANDLLTVAYKKAKINDPDITLNYYKQTFQAAPTTLLSPSALIVPKLLKKRKRSEECEAASSNLKARRIKSSHVGSGWIRYPRSLSPASKHQIFSTIKDDSAKEKYYGGRTALFQNSTPNNPTSLIKNAIKNAAKDTTTTTNAILPIRLAKPQRYDTAFTNPFRKGNKLRRIEKRSSRFKGTIKSSRHISKSSKSNATLKPPLGFKIQFLY